MNSFEAYLLKHKIKNLRYGDKIRYIGKGSFAVKPNEICTFLGLVEVSGELWPRIKAENYTVTTHPRNIIKV